VSDDVVTPQRTNSGKRKPVPQLPEGYGYRYDDEISGSRGFEYGERLRVRGNDAILSPRPQRDTIHHIVDHYADDGEDRNEAGNSDPRISIMSATTVSSDRDHSLLEGKDGKKGKEGMEGKEEGENVLIPPGPIFDLTPGREPSPARYKHGEPLHFGKSLIDHDVSETDMRIVVGEEEEEDY